MNRSVIIQLGVACAVLLVAGGGYWWWSARVAQVQAAVATLSTDISTKQAALARADTTRTELTALTKDEAAMGAYIVSESDIVTFLGVLESTGRATGAHVSVVSVTPQHTTAHATLSVSVKVTGSFGAVMRTVGAIENVPYYVVINSLSLSATQAPTNARAAASWDASLTLTTAYTASTTPVTSTTTP
ncbi:MAG: hypothetical protein B7X04_03745 [Parcubacteria group bacterium 21-54-25]|nr:MAG: hypothetical protein B7X04_03745 [Parcubacteria group bacterium 21-54-25]HQU08270.1 type 4a pilus biogenesis protein PilO [Candidatus Paceibacterota bacterium]